MTVQFTVFTAKPLKIEAIQVTEENIEELAVWMGASSYSVKKTLVGGKKKVEFFAEAKNSNGYPDRDYRLIGVRIGDYLVKVPAHITEALQDYDQKFWAVDQSQIDKFVRQSMETGEIDILPPYDR